MKKIYIILAVIVVAVVGIFGWFIKVRNNFVTLEEDLNQQWAKVEVQYQRRLDLIPNLVETVKGYATHESQTFENVTKARAGLSDAYNKAAAEQANASEAMSNEASMDNFNKAQQGLGKALSIYVNAVHEAYPELKADEQFKSLQDQLEGTENRISTERGRYTESVNTYNKAVRVFPESIVASISGFNVKPQFKADAEAATAPKISF